MKPIKRISFAIALLTTVALFLFGYTCSTSNERSIENVKEKSPVVNSATVDLKMNMRKLWSDHVIWTRNVILCLVDDLPGTDEASQRLLQNQADIGDAFKYYYGEKAGNKLTELLKAHINIAAEVVKAAKAGNVSGLEEATEKWNANADEISVFLCEINPEWELTGMKVMMKEHLKITTDEAVQRIEKKYSADIIAFDKIHSEILMMADIFSDGIVKQFPEKFGSSYSK